MGLFDDDDLELDDLLESVKKYPSCVVDLNEGEVQAIFNRCLATSTSVEKTSSILFYREFGYEKDDIGIVFDKNALHANRKNIEYLYGQLAAIHGFETIIKMEDFAKSYGGFSSGKTKTPGRKNFLLSVLMSIKQDWNDQIRSNSDRRSGISKIRSCSHQNLSFTSGPEG